MQGSKWSLLEEERAAFLKFGLLSWTSTAGLNKQNWWSWVSLLRSRLSASVLTVTREPNTTITYVRNLAHPVTAETYLFLRSVVASLSTVFKRTNDKFKMQRYSQASTSQLLCRCWFWRHNKVQIMWETLNLNSSISFVMKSTWLHFITSKKRKKHR